MNLRLIKMVPLLLLLLAAGCARPVIPQKSVRFFWPPPPVQPRFEFIDFFMADKDLDRFRRPTVLDVILGVDEPVPLFKSPMDVASDGRRVMVTDPGMHQVSILDRVSKTVRRLRYDSGDPVPFSLPYGVAIDPQGNAYVSDSLTGKIFIFDRNETLVNTTEEERLSRPTGLTVDPVRGRLYAVDTAEHRLVIFSLDGKLIDTWGKRGPGQGTFNFPVDVDLDADGNVYVLDSLNARVQVLDPDGAFLRDFGERGTALGSFQVPKGLAVSKSGLVAVTDSMSAHMVIFNLSGDYLLTIGGRQQLRNGIVSPGGFYLPAGIDFDDAEALWIADSLNRMIHQFQYLTDDYLAAHPIDAQQAVGLEKLAK